ncbi:MAG: tRNA 2-thiouridine(34) synthase MnmA [Elusimicrobiales bacterium]
MAKVVVAMSGGVDSSVSALLLKKQGFEVIGIHLRLFDNDLIKCCGGNESEEKFRRICSYIGIKHYVKDARKIFKENVINNFVKSYISGFTPNPCVECNRFLKFSYLLEISNAMGADFLATGHYAIIRKLDNGFCLERGNDLNKDQSYFLYCIKKENLGKIIFPVGGLLKKDVKKIAEKEGLPLETDNESKDICFIPKGGYSLFMKRKGYINSSWGFIRDTLGKIVGRHKGYFNYTIGQRKNLGICAGRRLYVIDIKPKENEIVVGEHKDAFKKKIIIKDINLLSDIKNGSRVMAQIRYRHTPSAGIIRFGSDVAEFEFDQPQFALTPGQSCVFYEGNRVLGGGIIYSVVG